MNEDAKRKYIEEGLEDVNLMVEAGAGAGKTHIMIRRIINLIKRGVPLESIVLITFTNKAANEMKERLQNSLLVEGQTGCEMISRAVNDLHKANVSTIHSFAKKIIEEMPLETIGLEFKIIEDLEFQKRLLHLERLFIRDERENSRIGALVEELTIYPNLRSLFDIYLLNKNMDYMVRDEEVVIKERKELMEDAWNLWEPFEQLLLEAGSCLKKDAYKSLSSAHKSRRVRFDRLEYVKNMLKALNDGFKIYSEAGLSAFEGKDGIFLLNKNSGKAHFGLELKASKEALETFYKLKKQEYEIALISLIKFVDYYMEKNNSVIPLLSNSELLYYALKTLERVGARRHFQRKYSHFFVDEFQDTDPIQVKLLFSLAASNDGDLEGIDIESINLMPGKLFLVGDPKQSIYRFRGADLNIYNLVKNKFLRDERFIELNRTYRYHEGLGRDFYRAFKGSDGYGFSSDSKAKIQLKEIEAVRPEPKGPIKNILSLDFKENFLGLMSTYLEIALQNTEDPDFVEALKGEIFKYINKNIKSIDIGALETFDEDLLVSIEENSRLSLLKIFLKDYGAIDALYNSYLKDGKFTLLDEDKLIGQAVALAVNNLISKNDDIQYRDILVISKFKKILKDISDALRDYNIPINSAEEKTFGHFIATEILISFYKYLISGNESHLKMFFNLSLDLRLEEIETMFINNDDRVLEMKDLYMAQNQSNNPLMAAYKLLYEREYLSSSSEDELEIATSLLEQLSNLSPSSLEDILNFMEDFRSTITPAFEGGNKLRIMNLHKAKGLEGRIVILVGEGKPSISEGEYLDREEKEAFLEFRELLWGRSKISYKDSFLPSEKIEKAVRNSKREVSEENLRLDYVAATRARDAIILIDPAGVYKELYERAENKTRLILEDIDINPKKEVQYKRKLVKSNNRNGGYIVKYPSKLDHAEDFLELEGDFLGKEYGIFFHKLMEITLKDYLNNENINIDSIFNRGAKIFARSNPISPLLGKKQLDYDLEYLPWEDKLSLLRSKILKSSSKSIVKILQDLEDDLKNADYIGVESPFVFEKSKNGQKILYRGVIDLIIKKLDKIKVYDYKTNARPSGFSDQDFTEYLMTKYQGQLEIYRLAASEIFNTSLENIDAKIIYTR